MEPELDEGKSPAPPTTQPSALQSVSGAAASTDRIYGVQAFPLSEGVRCLPRCYSIRIWLPILSLLYQGKHWIRFLFFTHMLWTHNFHFGTLKFFTKCSPCRKKVSRKARPRYEAPPESGSGFLCFWLHFMEDHAHFMEDHSWLIRTKQARASEHHRQVPPPRTLSRLRRKDILTQVIN